ncbi:MAG: CHASE3 domain-containing protein [Pyrinomonadaceae bacterium]
MKLIRVDGENFRLMLLRAFALPLVLMGLLAAVLLWQINALLSEHGWLLHTDNVIATAYLAEKTVLDMQTGRRGYLLTGDKFFLQPYERARATINPIFAKLQSLVSDNPEQTRRVQAIRTTYERWDEFARESIRLRDTGGDYTSQVGGGEGERLMNDMRAQFDSFINTEESLRAARSDAAQRSTQVATVTSVGLTLLLGTLLAYFVRRQLLTVSESYKEAVNTSRQQAEALAASEERYRAFVKQSTEAIWRFEIKESLPVDIPADDQITHFYEHAYLAECNDAFAQMYGYREANEITGARLGDILSRADERNVEYLRSFIGNKYQLTDAESCEFDKEGRPKYFLNNLTGIVENGKVSRAWGTQRDITARKRIEEERAQLLAREQAARAEAEEALHIRDTLFRALRENEARYRSLVVATSQIVWTAKADGEVDDIPEWRAVTGQSAEEVKGHGWLVALHPEDRAHVAETWNEAVNKKSFYDTEYRLRMRDGNYRHFAARGVPVLEEDGGIREWVGTCTDITERKGIEESLREQTEVVETVNSVGQILSAELDLQRLVQAVTDAATELTDAQFGAFFYNVNDERGESFTLYTISGVPREAFINLPMPRNTSVFGPTFGGEGIVRLADVREDERYGKNPPYLGMPEGHLSVASYMAVPVISRSGKVLGGLFFGHENVGVFNERDEQIVSGLAAQAAVAVDNALLFGAAERARAQAEASEERAAFLSRASETLTASLDYETTLASVAESIVPFLADWCVIDMLDEEGSLRRLAVAHLDPAKVEVARELQERYPPTPDGASAVSKVMRAGRSEFYQHITNELLEAITKDAEHLRMIRRLGLRSAMVVPLIARDRTLGAITFVTAESHRVYTEHDLAFAEDLARRAATAVDNARLYREAQHANIAKDEFLATLSHELRTPLTPIIGWTHMMRGGMLPAEHMKQGLAVIDKNSQSLTRLINDLLDMSAILSGKMRILRQPVDVAAAIVEAIETVRPQASARSIEIEFERGAKVSSLISGDRTRVVQIFWNLLHNAVKFSHDGGRVRVACASEAENVRIDIVDEGQGIRADFLPHVFERFRQADGSNTRAYGGLGLGLALVKSFVEAHGGTVTVDSAGAERGSCFSLRLPRVRNMLPDEKPESSSTATTVSTHEAAHVLLVEDASDTLEMLHTVFTQRGYRVTACESAEEALRVAARSSFDIIVSDIGLPNMSGYELIKKLRLLPGLSASAVPAIALTGYARERDVEAALSAGFEAHIPKPVDPSKLVLRVEELLRQDTEKKAMPKAAKDY